MIGGATISAYIKLESFPDGLAGQILFIPIFLAHFSAHTDGFLISTPKGNWLGDPEGGILFMQGRPLWTYLDSFIGWFVKSVTDLSSLRLFVFFIKLLTGFLLYHFCHRQKSGEAWAALIAFCFLLLPSNIINVIWVCNGAPESISLLFGILSYLSLEKCTDLRPRWEMAGAPIFFLIALLVYQPTAVIVFSFMFLKLLFQETFSWEILRLRFMLEICFYGAILILYWFLFKHFIIPFGQHLNFPLTVGDIYRTDLVNNISTKLPLIIDIIKYSLISTWDLILHDRPFDEWLMIAVFVASIFLFIIQRKLSFNFSTLNASLQKLILACTLFLLANTPELMAINYKTVVGYRTLLPGALIGLGLFFYSLKFIYLHLKNERSKKIAVYLMEIYFLGLVSTAAWTIQQTVLNDTMEYNYLNSIASQIDYHKTDKIIMVLNKPRETVIDNALPFEFSYMTTVSAHSRYIFDKYNTKTGKEIDFRDAYLGWPLYMDDYTKVVDLTLLCPQKNTYAKLANRTLVSPTDPSGQKILVQQIEHKTGGPLLLFKEGSNDAFWQIDPGVPKGVINFYFMDTPEIVVGYSLVAACMNAQRKPSDFLWVIQGSIDNKHWNNLSIRLWSALGGKMEGNFFNIPKYYPIKHLRFTFFKKNTNDLLLIAAIQLKDFQPQK